MWLKVKIVKSVLRGTIKQKGFSRKIKYLKYVHLAAKNGVVHFRWERIASEYLADYYADTGIDKKDKEWFYQRGIPSFKVKWYGLTKENYTDYISDFDFYSKRNYMNSEFEEWFEHKLNTYYLLAPFKSSMPKHYYYAHQGTFSPIDVNPKHDGTVDDIINLIKEQPVAVKACRGGHGKGFYKMSYSSSSGFVVNGKTTNEADLRELILNLYSYIITEYGIPHKELRNLCGEDAFSVIRTVTVYDEKSGGNITAAIIRLGCKEAGVVTDYDGTIYCGVDLNDGHLFSPIYRTGDDEGILIRKDIEFHPDTNKKIEGFVLPNFDKLKKLVKDISEYLPVTPYLVMDIIPTDDGFQILEINSHGQVRVVEPFYPFLKNPLNRKVFNLEGE